MSTSNQHPITPNPLTHSNLISKHTQNSIPTRYNSNYSNHSIREQREPASTHTQSPDTLKLDLQAHSEFNTHTLQQQPQHSIHEQREPASNHTQSPDTLKLDLQTHSELNTHTLQQQPQYPQHP